jgi:hypothetical protein
LFITDQNHLASVQLLLIWKSVPVINRSGRLCCVKCIKQHLISIETELVFPKKTIREIIQERVKRIELANNKRPIRKFNE